MKILGLLKSIAQARKEKKEQTDRLYYLSGVKRIKANKYVLDECTVGKES